MVWQEEMARARNSSVELSSLKLERNKLKATIEALAQENQVLRDRVDKLQIKLDIKELYRNAITPDLTAGRPPESEAPEYPDESAFAQAPSSGKWFVNFGSYFNRATAQAWRERLTPSSGTVTIATAGPEERPLYRLRIVGLATREEAETMASKLEEKYKLDKLWVGNQ